LLTPASCLARFNTDGAGDDADDDADGCANNDSNDDDEEEEEEEVDDVKEKAAPSAEVKGDGEGNGFFAAGDTCYACFPEVNAIASPRARSSRLACPSLGNHCACLWGAPSRVCYALHHELVGPTTWLYITYSFAHSDAWKPWVALKPNS